MEQKELWQESIQIPKRCRNFMERRERAEWFLEELQKMPESCAVVTAPAGSGKTQLFAEIAGRSGKAVWYQLKEQDQEPFRFLTLLNEAVWECFGTCAELWEKQKFYADNGKLEEWLEVWKADVQNRKETGILIFDHMEVIRERRFQEWFQHMVSNDGISAQIKVVFLTREPLSFLAKAEAEGNVRHYGFLDCFFRAEETEAFLKEFGKAEAKRMQELFAGFPAGISMAAVWCRQMGEVPAEPMLLAGCGIYRLLSYECLERLSGRERRFLAETSVLKSWDIVSGNAVSDVREAEFVWHYLLEHNLFVVIEKGQMSYLPFFRHFLEFQLTAAERKELLLRAADYYVSSGQEETAVFYAKKGNNTEFLNDFLCRQGRELLEQGKKEILGECIQNLEQERKLDNAPAYGMAAQYFYAAGEDQKTVSYYLNRADSMFGHDNSYGAYRTIYRALELWRKAQEQKEQEMSEELKERVCHAVDFLKREQEQLPFLLPQDLELLEQMTGEHVERKEAHVLNVQYFGSFSVLVMPEGKPLPWRTRKEAELFACLARAKEPLDRKSLMEMLWGENPPESAVAMLHNNIHHLRKELDREGFPEILVYQKKKYSLNHAYICNVSEGTEAAMKKLSGGGKLNRKELIASFSKYPGTFMEGFDSRWCNEKRTWYDHMYEQGALQLASEYRRQGEGKKAATVLEALYHMNPFSEAAVEQLLYCYAEEKERKKMKLLYEDYERMLKKELGIMPGRKIRAILSEHLS